MPIGQWSSVIPSFRLSLPIRVRIVITLLKRERPYNLEIVQHWHGKEISVTSTPKQTVQCDGEALKETPLHIKAIPGAIKVLVPKEMSIVIE
jgi:diacylglycerol kinase family enzyme